MARSIDVQMRLTALDRTGGALAGVSRNLRDIDRQANAINRSGRTMGRSFGAMGRSTGAMSRSAGAMASATGAMNGTLVGMGARFVGPAAMGYALVEATNSARNFETRLTEIRKKAGLTAEETRKLGEEAKALATSGEIAAPLDEILAGYERGAAAGVLKDDLKEFAFLSAKASDALEMPAEDIGNAMGVFNKTIGVAMKDMEALLDVTNALEDAGTASASGIIDVLSRAGPMMKNVGFTPEQTAALAATALNAGLPSDVASRMLNTVFTKMIEPGSSPAYKAFEDIVGDVEAFQKLMRKDPQKGWETLIEAMSKMDSHKGLSAAAGWLGLGFADEFQRMSSTAKDYAANMALAQDRSRWLGSLDKSYGLKMDTFDAKMRVFQNRLKALSIDAGNLALPGLTKGMEGITAVLNRWEQIGNPFEEMQAGAAGFAKGMGFENFSSMMSAAGTAVEQFLGITRNLSAEGGDSLGATFAAWQERGQALLNTLLLVENALLSIEQLGLATRQAEEAAGSGWLKQGSEKVEGFFKHWGKELLGQGTGAENFAQWEKENAEREAKAVEESNSIAARIAAIQKRKAEIALQREGKKPPAPSLVDERMQGPPMPTVADPKTGRKTAAIPFADVQEIREAAARAAAAAEDRLSIVRDFETPTPSARPARGAQPLPHPISTPRGPMPPEPAPVRAEQVDRAGALLDALTAKAARLAETMAAAPVATPAAAIVPPPQARPEMQMVADGAAQGLAGVGAAAEAAAGALRMIQQAAPAAPIAPAAPALMAPDIGTPRAMLDAGATDAAMERLRAIRQELEQMNSTPVAPAASFDSSALQSGVSMAKAALDTLGAPVSATAILDASSYLAAAASAAAARAGLAQPVVGTADMNISPLLAKVAAATAAIAQLRAAAAAGVAAPAPVARGNMGVSMPQAGTAEV